jgi:hypothetical protein
VGGRGRPDGRAPPVSVQRKRKKKGRRLGRRGKVSWAAWATCARREKRKAGGLAGFGFLFKFFSKSFFKLFKLHSNNKTMHSNHDAQPLIISIVIEMMFKYFKGQFI